MTSLQDILITANLMAIADKNKNNHDYSAGFDLNSVDKLSLFKSQKLQILANAHHYGVELSQSQKKQIEEEQRVKMDDVESNHFIEILKKNPKFSCKTTKISKVNKEKKVTKNPVDKERWMPLRDRSYYKPKAKYLKSISVKKTQK